MATQANVAILFFVDGERYDSRYWSHVPRVGDEVMLRTKDNPDRSGKGAFKVLRVVWGTEATNASAHDPQCCNVDLERVS